MVGGGGGMSYFSAKDLTDAARLVDVGPAHIATVATVESGSNGPFLETGHPVVLFERHKFHRYTGGRFDDVRPDLSNPKYGGYGKTSEQPGRLAAARALDDEPAVMSTSWGAFQLMGFNYKLAGFACIEVFEREMRRSARAQLMAFASFLKNTGLDNPLRELDWRAFARGYNGPDYERNEYHLKLERAWFRISDRMVA